MDLETRRAAMRHRAEFIYRYRAFQSRRGRADRRKPGSTHVKSGHLVTSGQCPLYSPKADMAEPERDVRFVPTTDISIVSYSIIGRCYLVRLQATCWKSRYFSGRNRTIWPTRHCWSCSASTSTIVWAGPLPSAISTLRAAPIPWMRFTTPRELPLANHTPDSRAPVEGTS
jgi:hypothetical protein